MWRAGRRSPSFAQSWRPDCRAHLSVAEGTTRHRHHTARRRERRELEFATKRERISRPAGYQISTPSFVRRTGCGAEERPFGVRELCSHFYGVNRFAQTIVGQFLIRGHTRRLEKYGNVSNFQFVEIYGFAQVNFASRWPTRRSRRPRLLSLFSQPSSNLIHRINAVDIIKSWWSGWVVSAPTPFA